jgi:hypothetical protein
VYAEAYKLMAKDLGYGSRQAMVEYVLKSTMDQYPNYLYEARPVAAVKIAVANHEEEFVPIMSKPTDEDLEYWQKELEAIPEKDDIKGLTDGVKEQINHNVRDQNVPHETPDLPDL